MNNGGRSQRSLFIDTNVSVYNAIMELNYLGTISLTKFVLDHMIQRKQGKIVTMSSVMGIMGAPLATGYCASKHALQVSLFSICFGQVRFPECVVSATPRSSPASIREAVIPWYLRDARKTMF